LNGGSVPHTLGEIGIEFGVEFDASQTLSAFAGGSRGNIAVGDQDRDSAGATESGSRGRLLERLHDGLGYDLVLVSAPAGFGKTTLPSDWLARDQLGAQTTSLSLDESDSDPVRFWEYFIAALRTVRPGVGEVALASIHSPQPLPAQSVLVPLTNELLGASQDLVLVLDDYQFIKSEENWPPWASSARRLRPES
jgi:hypothetical protein